jgi:hypothetical protein
VDIRAFNEFRERGALNEEECFIDATFAMAKGGGAEISATKRGKSLKIMAIVNRHGPLSVRTHAANHHEVRLVQPCFDFYMIEAKRTSSAIALTTAIPAPAQHRWRGYFLILPLSSNCLR